MKIVIKKENFFLMMVINKKIKMQWSPPLPPLPLPPVPVPPPIIFIEEFPVPDPSTSNPEDEKFFIPTTQLIVTNCK